MAARKHLVCPARWPDKQNTQKRPDWSRSRVAKKLVRNGTLTTLRTETLPREGR